MSELNITAIVETFASQITAAVEASVTQRLQAVIAGAFGAPAKRGPGRPPKPGATAATVTGKKTRPKQLCPVPGCKNLAAPVFGMVCSDHKNVAKSKIKKYRQERKAAPAGAAKGSPTKSTKSTKPAKAAKKASPKAARARKLQGQYMGALKSLTGADRDK
jgi:hypothetical protein